MRCVEPSLTNSRPAQEQMLVRRLSFTRNGQLKQSAPIIATTELLWTVCGVPRDPYGGHCLYRLVDCSGTRSSCADLINL